MRFQRFVQLTCVTVVLAVPVLAQDANTEEVHRKALKALRENKGDTATPSNLSDPEVRMRLRQQQDAVEPRGFLTPQYNNTPTRSSTSSGTAEERLRLLRQQQGASAPAASSSAPVSPQSSDTDEIHRKAIRALREQQSSGGASATRTAPVVTTPPPQTRTAPPAQQQQQRVSDPAPVRSASPAVAASSSDQVDPGVRAMQEQAIRALRNQPAGASTPSVTTGAAGSDSRGIETRASRLSQPSTTTPAPAVTTRDNSADRRTRELEETARRNAQSSGAGMSATTPAPHVPELTAEERANQRRALNALRNQRTSAPATASTAPRATSTTGRVTSQTTTAAPAAAPAVQAPAPTGRRAKLAALLEEYKADKISPTEYQQRRAAILSGPEN